MKIGIITFHASHNYGSMLQAYALQTYLEKQNHDVSIINYRSKAQKKVYPKPLSCSLFAKPKALASSVFRFKRTLLFMKKWKCFEDFLYNYLKLTKEYNSIEELNIAGFNFDVVLCGSDQIWNTNPVDFSVAYFLPFVKQIRKIAYAPSLGPTLSSSHIDKYVELINQFEAISVRESQSIPFVQSLVKNKEVVDCVDPTLLLERDDYRPLIDDEPVVNGQYIFFYAPANTSSGNDFLYIANELGKKEGYKVILTQYMPEYRKYPYIKTFFPVGPKEFLNLVYNSKFVCGRSFHLLVFSILFHKEFYTINSSKDARCNNLLNKVGIKDRDVTINSINQFQRSNIDYENVDDMLHQVRISSKQYLAQI